MAEMTPRRRLRKRLRRTAGALMENSGLRSHLDDDQADQLLTWGLAYVEAMAEQTIEQPDEEALPLLEVCVTTVSTVMRTVNRLTGFTDKPIATNLLDDCLNHFTQNLPQLTKQPLGLAWLCQWQQYCWQRLSLDKATTFIRLMDLITLKKTGEEKYEQEEK